MQLIPTNKGPLLRSNSLVLKINNLWVYFYLDKDVLKAVDGVNLETPKEKVLGLVRESGCGKITTGRCILRAVEATEEKILFKTEDKVKGSSERNLECRNTRQYG